MLQRSVFSRCFSVLVFFKISKYIAPLRSLDAILIFSLLQLELVRTVSIALIAGPTKADNLGLYIFQLFFTIAHEPMEYYE